MSETSEQTIVTEAPETSLLTDAEAPAVAEVSPAVVDDYEIVVPEGFVLDEGSMKEFKDLVKGANVGKDDANKLVAFHAALLAKQNEALATGWKATVDDWRKSSVEDAEFGGKAFSDSLRFARAALDKFGTPEMRTALNDTGVGNHPEIVRFMVKVGKSISEDSIRLGNPVAPPMDTAKLLFPDLN